MPNANRKILIGLFITFLVPMLFAGIFYYRGKPIGNPTNHGILINPPIAAGKVFPNLPAKWTMVWFNPDYCHKKECLTLLHELHQIKKAMGKRQNDAQIAVLTLNTHRKDLILRKILHSNPQIKSKTIAPKAYSQLLKLNATVGMIYLMDPRKNIMMRYPQNVDTMNIYKDFSKLLKYTS